MLKPQTQSGLLTYLIGLTAFFFLIEVSFFIQLSGFYLSDFKMVSDHLAIPSAVIPAIIFFIFAQCFVHLLYPVLIWGLTRLMAYACRLTWKTTERWGFALWGVGLVYVLVLNQLYFPNSKYAELDRVLFNQTVAEGLLIVLSCLFVGVLIVACVGILRFGLTQKKVLYIPLVLGLMLYLCLPAKVVISDAGSSAKPNIILIGVDALRPDYLSFFGSHAATPRFDKQLQQSVVFSNALTPLARTFPAWVSVLTGEYPKHHGARFDLAKPSEVHWEQSLPRLLKAQGYQTVYAMDETRFSNIDKRAGFDRMITPPVGFNDFLLGTFNDFPLSNLVVNTPLGKWLFPYSYGNRAAFITYDPNSFLALLQPFFNQPRVKPLFVAVHFCLPHFPYFWSRYSYTETTNAALHYQAAVIRADQQIGDFLTLLQTKGILQHSIVVLFSDHGEALELPGDRLTAGDHFVDSSILHNQAVPHFYPPSFDDEKVNESAGHGTDVLSFTQYHTVLAFRFSEGAHIPHIVPNVVSLLDIKPTLLAYLQVPSVLNDGVSLLPALSGSKSVGSDTTDLFLESDFSPQAVRSVHPETRKLLFEGIDFFEINPVTTQLTVKPSMRSLILSSKQYADRYQDWILALYPQASGQLIPILLNLKTGHWTNDLTSSFANSSPYKHMVSALKRFYGDDVNADRLHEELALTH